MKKGKGIPTALEVPLPVIFSVVAIYFRVNVTLYRTEQLSPCSYSLPRQAFFGSPQLAGTTACGLARQVSP
jgi:hypothetical protein